MVCQEMIRLKENSNRGSIQPVKFSLIMHSRLCFRPVFVVFCTCMIEKTDHAKQRLIELIGVENNYSFAI